MKLPTPTPRYDPTYEARRDAEIQREDRRNRKTDGDVELIEGAKLVLLSPDGARWSITVSNAGVISAVAL